MSRRYIFLGLVSILVAAFGVSSQTLASTPDASVDGACPGSKSAEERRNKEAALNFYREVYQEKNVDAIDKYIAENYIEHSPHYHDGRQILKSASKEWLAYGQFDVEILRAAAEGDLVFVHLKLISKYFNEMLGGTSSIAIVDVLRFENGMIAEHWEVTTPYPEKSVSKHPLF